MVRNRKEKKNLDKVQAGPSDCHSSVSFAVKELRSNSILSDVMRGLTTLPASSGLRKKNKYSRVCRNGNNSIAFGAVDENSSPFSRKKWAQTILLFTARRGVYTINLF